MDQRLTAFAAPERVDEAELDALPWEWTTPVVSAGQHALRVRTSGRQLGEHVQGLLSGFPPGSGPACTYRVVEGVNGNPRWWAVYAGAQRISTIGASSAALTHLFSHVNRAVVAQAPPLAVPLHAAACARDGRALLLTGPSESGKSTLAAALGQRGLQYLTDEVAVLDAARLDIAPYAKPLSVDAGVWHLLPDLSPELDGGPAGVGETQWHVAPHRLAGGAAVEPASVHAVVRCRWQSGARLRLEPAEPAQAVADLVLDGFRPRARLLHQVGVLARLVERTGVLHLVYSDLAEALAALDALLEG